MLNCIVIPSERCQTNVLVLVETLGSDTKKINMCLMTFSTLLNSLDTYVAISSWIPNTKNSFFVLTQFITDQAPVGPAC